MTKFMSTEELHDYNVDNEEIEIIKDFVHLSSLIKPNATKK